MDAKLLALATALSNNKPGSRTRAVEMLRRLAAKPADEGEREAIARIIEPWSWHHKDRGTASNQVMAQVEDSLLRADAILSLPIQPGAAEWGMPVYEKRALGIIRLATEQAEEIRDLLSRQAPHSDDPNKVPMTAELAADLTKRVT